MENDFGSQSPIIILCLLAFSSCCNTNDSRVPPGYPFDGHSQELNYIDYYNYPRTGSDPNHYSYPEFRFLDSTYIKDTTEWNDLFQKIDPSYKCDIDFNKHSLAYMGGLVGEVFEAKFQKRVLINHKARTYTIEIRAYTKACNSGLNSNYTYYYVHDFILIPKVPEGYFFDIVRYNVRGWH